MIFLYVLKNTQNILSAYFLNKNKCHYVNFILSHLNTKYIFKMLNKLQ